MTSYRVGGGALFWSSQDPSVWNENITNIILRKAFNSKSAISIKQNVLAETIFIYTIFK